MFEIHDRFILLVHVSGSATNRYTDDNKDNPPPFLKIISATDGIDVRM